MYKCSGRKGPIDNVKKDKAKTINYKTEKESKVTWILTLVKGVIHVCTTCACIRKLHATVYYACIQYMENIFMYVCLYVCMYV